MASSPNGTANLYDPIEVARANPYFKRNHMGQVTCTLCGIYCPEENNFLKHIAGKTHTLQLERRQHKELRHLRLQEEERLNTEAEERARKEEALLALSGGPVAGSSTDALSSATAAAAANARFGTPLYSFRTEHDEVAYRTKVWVEVIFTQAEEGTRPLHRWLSAREQHVERPADDYFVYLLFACEGYATIALKFPAKVSRSQPRDVLEETDGSTSEAYWCSWDPLKKLYSLFFVLSR
ncbi:putative Pre-mRNA-splicing factor SF3a complex subunit 2 (Prp11) [Leishmania utingensis]|uniref:Pre-mRNA-splicing factor SF3a complex subunit 2 (Prp11) n=1 Tax=Leishmania utingensis TaxID=653362 RepID=A0AAW3B382_9TRYP